jgi:hypothetical protein
MERAEKGLNQSKKREVHGLIYGLFSAHVLSYGKGKEAINETSPAQTQNWRTPLKSLFSLWLPADPTVQELIALSPSVLFSFASPLLPWQKRNGMQTAKPISQADCLHQSRSTLILRKKKTGGESSSNTLKFNERNLNSSPHTRLKPQKELALVDVLLNIRM